MFKQLLLSQVALALMLTTTSVVAQKPGELESKYGPPLNAYVIRPGLLMMAKYAVSGQVCEMSVVEAPTAGSNISLRTPLTREFVAEVIDELIPQGERGEKIRSYGLVQTQGSTAQSFYNYQNVSIELVQNFTPSKGWSDDVLKIKWTNRICK